MRLSPFDVDTIKKAITEFVKEYKLYLHGSRLDDHLKGGDIDLFIVVPNESIKMLKEKKHYLDARLSLSMKDQKIDITMLAEAETVSNHFFNSSDKLQL